MFSKDISKRKRASCLAFHILTGRVIYLDTTLGEGFTIAIKTICFTSTSKLEQLVQKDSGGHNYLFCWGNGSEGTALLDSDKMVYK